MKILKSPPLWIYSSIAVISALIVGLAFLNPLWSKYSPPFPMSRVFPAITAPVDGPFYLKNAEIGYQWNTRDPKSLWFHPLMSFLVMIMPSWLSDNIWFWLISIIFGLGSLILTYSIAKIYIHKDSELLQLLPFMILVPGGLEVATGNPEIPTLFFTSLLLISVLQWQYWFVTATFGILAILTKPNALYMIAILSIYFFAGVRRKDTKLVQNSIIGILSISLGWALWILFVDWQTGSPGAYWRARDLFSNYVAGNPFNFFVELARSFIYSNELRDKIRYSTAIIIPIVNFWLIGGTPFSKEEHRYALAAGNMAMLLLVLWQGNPNKVIVYTTTLPGYFPIHIITIYELLMKYRSNQKMESLVIGSLYIIYCLSMLIVYILGTPLGWYY